MTLGALAFCTWAFSCSFNNSEGLQKIAAVEVGNRTDIPTATAKVKLERTQLPQNFKIDVWAADIPNARSLAMSEEGIVLV